MMHADEVERGDDRAMDCPGVTAMVGLADMLHPSDGLGLLFSHTAALLETLRPAASRCTRREMLAREPDPARRIALEEAPCPTCPVAAHARAAAADRWAAG